MAAQAQWQLSGDYFENCNCSVVCPCLVSKSAPLTSRPTEGECNVGSRLLQSLSCWKKSSRRRRTKQWRQTAYCDATQSSTRNAVASAHRRR